MEILSNDEVIAINQDPSFTGGDRIFNDTDGRQVWARDLANGDKCVVLYNSGNGKTHGKEISDRSNMEDVGLGSKSDPADNIIVHVRDLWEKSLGNYSGGYNGTIAVRDVQMLRLRRYGE